MTDMLPEHYEEVKELINRIAEYYGPVEENPLLEEQTAEMCRLTGRDWDAEEVGNWCFEYWSRASLDETAYFFFHGDLPESEEIELVFWKLKPGVNMEPQTLFEKLRYVKTCAKVKAVELLPMEEIVSQLEELLSGWDRQEGLDLPVFRKVQEPWHTEEVRLFGYEGKMLSITCTNVPEADRTAILQRMAGFGCAVYRPED